MVYRIGLTYDEIVDILELKYIGPKTVGCTVPPGINKVSDLNLVLKSLLPKEIKVKITIDDSRL